MKSSVKQNSPVVFVVDDDTAVRESLDSLIRSVGLRVETFSSAHEFLRHELPDVPACLVLDVRMPGQSGLDLQHELGAKDRTIPIIFITSFSTAEARCAEFCSFGTLTFAAPIISRRTPFLGVPAGWFFAK